MKIHEYQAKNLFREYGVPVLEGIACFSVEEAIEASIKLGGDIWAVKAQIHAGGRGKGGGVKVARSLDDVKEYAGEILGMKLITHQTDRHGQIVRRLFIEQGAAIQKEFYIGMLVDRSSQRVCLMVSSEGGMNIEEVANKTPEKINKVLINPIEGLTSEDAYRVAQIINFPQCDLSEITTLLQNLYKLFDSTDALLVEINPLVLTTDNHFLALDAKMSFDDNALFRHSEIEDLRDLDEEDPLETEASKHDLSYVPLDGNIGCLVNGAGLAMATMDIIKLYGGNPANFLDVGGGATTEKVTEAFKLMLCNTSLRAILVNIFGGIMKCDVIASGVVKAAREVKLS
jgi:succinyl-CoA synthetase beta subunit